MNVIFSLVCNSLVFIHIFLEYLITVVYRLDLAWSALSLILINYSMFPPLVYFRLGLNICSLLRYFPSTFVSVWLIDKQIQFSWLDYISFFMTCWLILSDTIVWTSMQSCSEDLYVWAPHRWLLWSYIYYWSLYIIIAFDCKWQLYLYSMLPFWPLTQHFTISNTTTILWYYWATGQWVIFSLR